MSPLAIVREFLKRWALVIALGIAAAGWSAAAIQSVRVADLKAKHANEAKERVEEAREQDRKAGIENGKIVDELLARMASSAASAAAIDARLRKLSSERSELAASCARADEAPGSVLSDDSRAMAFAETKRAQEVADRLIGLQAWAVMAQNRCK